MLEKVDKIGDMSNNDKADYKAMVHFIRGYAYYVLLQNWGPCLIVGDEVISTSEKADYYDRERATMDESIDYICNEFAQSLPGLKRPSEQSTAYFGRPTRGTALALIARLRLIQASPTLSTFCNIRLHRLIILYIWYHCPQLGTFSALTLPTVNFAPQNSFVCQRTQISSDAVSPGVHELPQMLPADGNIVGVA